MAIITTPKEVATKLDKATDDGVWRNDGRALTLQLASIFGLRYNESGAVKQASQFRINELAWTPSLTFNGVVSEIGQRQNFDCLSFSIFPFNSDFLPDAVRVAVALGTYNAAPLVDILIPLPNVVANQPITVTAELGQLIENPGSLEVFVLVATNGRIGYASATEYPATFIRYFSQVPPVLSLTVSPFASVTPAVVSPYGELLTKSFNCGTRNVFTNGHFAGVYYTNSTFSGWGNQLTAVPQPFNFLQMWMNAFDGSRLPTECRVIFRDTDAVGAVLGTAVANVSFGSAGLQLVSIFFDSDVDLSSASNVWFGFATDGFVSLCRSNILSATGEVYAAGPSGIDGGIGGVVPSAPKYQPWIRTALLDVQNGLRYDAGAFYKSLRSANVTAEAFTANAEVTLPPSLFAVVGQELNIYYDGAINSALRQESLTMHVNAGIGRALRHRWTYTPASAGDSSLTLNTLFNGDVIATATTTVKTKAATVGSGQSRKALFIGDSLVQSSYITLTVLDDVTANTDSDYSLTLLGTLGAGANKYEGRGGWTYGSYCVDGSSPFSNSGVFDFPYYLTNSSQSMSAGDSVFLLLGTNDLYGADTDGEADVAIASMADYLASMIASIQGAVAGINIFIGMIPQPCYDADGFRDAAPSVGYPERIKRNYGRWRSFLTTTYGASEATKIYLAAVNCCLDTRNNFPTTTVALNARNASTETVITNPVHPATIGYQQIGDYCWACLMSLES